MKRLSFLFILVSGFVLAACSSTSGSPIAGPAAESTAILPDQPLAASTKSSPAQPAGVSAPGLVERTDSQGAVTITVKPLDLGSSQNALVFEVSMNTHSVDLSMDLAKLATLTTDNGQSVQATVWDATPGGHHVSGKLSFPASVDGKPILEGATKMTLDIKNVDAPERVFAWDLK